MRPHAPGRTLHALAVSVATCSLVSLAATRADAAGLLAPATGKSIVVSAEEIATTFGTDQSTTWTRLSASSGGFLWLVPLPAGGRADIASDAWLAALDLAAAPRVVSPSTLSPCADLATPELVTSVAHGTRLAPSDARLLGSDADLAQYAAGFDLEVETQAAAHAVLATGALLLALRFDDAMGPVRTATIRMSATRPATADLVSAMAGADVRAAFTTTYALGPGPAAFEGAPLSLATATLTWGALGSDYPSVRASALSIAGPLRFLVESSSHRALFMERLDQGLVVPSAAGSYFGLDACRSAAEELLTSSARVSRTCAPGALAWNGADGCVATPLPGETDGNALLCGGDDLALALAHAIPSALTLTRAVRAGDSPVNVVLGGAESSAVLHATEYDLACRSAAGVPGAASGGGGGGGGGGVGLGGGGSADPSADVSAGVDVTSSDSCAGSSADSSSSDSSSGDSCGSSSDTSGGSSGDGCSSSSGADSSSSGGCSGDSGASGAGDACSGAGAGGGGDCSTAGRKHGRRSPFSRVAMGALAALLVWRRKSRPRTA